MSFIDDLINKGKEYVTQYSDSLIVDIKADVGKSFQLRSEVNALKSQIKSGSYNADIITKFNVINERQNQIDEQVQRFTDMTNTATDQFGNIEFSLDYLKGNWENISSVGSIGYQFLTETRKLISTQEDEISQLKELMAGSSQVFVNMKSFVKNHWLATLVGILIVRKILR